MRTSSELISYLPRLRRYARALCGNRADGDDLVMRTIRSLDAARLEGAHDPLIVMFRSLNAIWRDSLQARPDRAAAKEAPRLSCADRRLASLPPPARQAFLLSSLERFTREEAGEILDLPPVRFAEMLAESERTFRRLMATRVLIIEDDRFVAADLEAIMTKLGHAVCGIATTRQEAVRLAGRQSPGLILCDLKLADGSSGLGAVDDIHKATLAPAIFITGNRHRLAERGDRLPEFLISKPYSPEDIRAASHQALFFRSFG